MKTIKIILIWSLLVTALCQGFGQIVGFDSSNNQITMQLDSMPKYLITGGSNQTLTSEASYTYSSTLEIKRQQNYTTDTVDAIILVSKNDLPVHTIEGKWIKYRWATNWLMDWWSKPDDQILDINFQSLDPSYYVWDYKTKK